MSHNHQHRNQGNIKVAFFLNLAFSLVEIVGGIFTNSVAIVADALHDLGDSLSLGLAWWLEKLSGKRRDQRFSFGYRRLSLLAALINGIVLVGGSIFVLWKTIPRLLAPEAVHVPGMFWLAALGIAVNGLAVLRLRSGSSMNEKVVSWHLLEDVLGWVAVLIVSIIMYFKPLPILDPLLSLVITAVILWNVIKRVKQTSAIFLQAIPEGIDIDAIEQSIDELTGVVSVHDTHIWSLDGEHHIASTHVVTNDVTIGNSLLIRQQVREIFSAVGINHVTVEIEAVGEDCVTADC